MPNASRVSLGIFLTSMVAGLDEEKVATQKKSAVGFEYSREISDSLNLRHSKHILLVLTPPVSLHITMVN